MKPSQERTKYLKLSMVIYSCLSTILALWQLVFTVTRIGSVIIFVSVILSNTIVNLMFAFVARVAPIDAEGWTFHMRVKLAF